MILKIRDFDNHELVEVETKDIKSMEEGNRVNTHSLRGDGRIYIDTVTLYFHDGNFIEACDSDRTLIDTIKACDKSFVDAWNRMAETVFQNAAAHGFWPDNHLDRNLGEALCLIHSEISEALESIRHNNPPSEKCPGFTNTEEEIADAVIRILDTSRGFGWDIAGAIEAKHKYNVSRPFKHGKEF